MDSSPTAERGSGRLQLARQIADSANPLTARVMVNRVWHHLFGRGIAPSIWNRWVSISPYSTDGVEAISPRV